MNWNALGLCLLASLLYAAEIVLAESTLKNVRPITMTLFFGLGIVICSAPFFVYGMFHPDADGKTVELPVGKEWLLIFAISILTFLADWSHFGALKRHAGGVVLATFYVLIPVFCTMMKGEWPSSRMVLAWILGGLALLLISDELRE